MLRDPQRCLSSSWTPSITNGGPRSLGYIGVRALLGFCNPGIWGQKGADPLVQARSDAPVEMAIKETFSCPEIAIEFSILLHIYFSFPGHLTIVWFEMLAACPFPCQSTAKRKLHTINLLGWAPGLLPTQAETSHKRRPFLSPRRAVNGCGD